MTLRTAFWIISLGLICAAGIGYWNIGEPLMQPDSQGYIDFAPSRTVGYPLFLALVQRLMGTLAYVGWIQWALFSITAIGFGLFIARWLRSPVLGALIMVGLFLKPFNNDIFAILTEGLSMTMGLLIIISLIRVYQHPSLFRALVLGVLVGVTFLIRPVHVAYIPAIAIALLAVNGVRRFRVAGAFLVGACTLVLTGASLQYQWHGFFGNSQFLGSNLIGKAAVLADETLAQDLPRPEIPPLVQAFAPYKAVLDHVPTMQGRYIILSPTYDHMRFKELAAYAPNYTDAQLTDLSLAIFKQRFRAYIDDVVMNLGALWFWWDLQTWDEQAALKDVLDKYASVPTQIYPWYPALSAHKAKSNPIIVYGVRTGLGFILALSIVYGLQLLWAIVRRQGTYFPEFLGGACSLILWGHYILIAMVQAGLPRYGLSMIMMHLVIGSLFLLDCKRILNIGTE